MKTLSWLGMLAIGLMAATDVRAHADIEQQVALLSRLIEQHPDNAEFYFRRAELYRSHQDWNAAFADYERAARETSLRDRVTLARSDACRESGRLAQAKALLDEFLAAHPAHAEALVIRARTLAALQQPVAAATDYTQSIALQPEPKPEYYIERAQTLARAGGSHVDEAIRGLEEGLKKLGGVIALELAALELELQKKDYAAAVARLDRIMAGSPRKEPWWARRGEVLEQAGRIPEARESYMAARQAIDQLPDYRRHVPATEALATTVQAALKRLGPQPTPESIDVQR